MEKDTWIDGFWVHVLRLRACLGFELQPPTLMGRSELAWDLMRVGR